MDPIPGQATIERLRVELRAAGCVFAEEEAALLVEAATDDADLRALTARRVAGEPLEHVIGWVDFGGLRLRIGPGAFVPRQRSLFVARLAADEALASDRPVLLELCCGVAPLAAVVAAAHPGARIIASDVDAAALEFARENVPGSEVYPGSLFAGLPASLAGDIDVITAVPPYVPDDALAEMPREAREHEPAGSLLGGLDGLDVVRAILDEAGRWMRPGGVVLLEMNIRQTTAAVGYARQRRFDASAIASDDGQTAALRASRG